MSAPEGTYAALGEHLTMIYTRLNNLQVAQTDGSTTPLLGAQESAFLSHLSVELGAADQIIQTLTYQNLVISRDAKDARKMVEDLQAHGTEQHERIVALTKSLEAATQFAARSAAAVGELVGKGSADV